jgi:maleamate amidohydrolase
MMTRDETEERAFFIERGFGRSMGFGERPALIVVDFMVAFTNPQLPLGASVNAEIDQANRLLDAAHEARIPVFFSSVSYDEPDLADAGVWPRKMEGLSTLRADAPHVAQDPRLHRAPADPVINKKYASCFFGTDFASRLHHRKIDTLLIAGCSTSGCVRATAVDACQNGYRPIVAREAVADRSPSAHAQTLLDIEHIYGDVVPVSEIVAYLKSIR